MRHVREEVIARVIYEYEQLEKQVASFSADDWNRSLLRPEGKDPWTVKDALAHITHWKADAARSVRKEHRPVEERGLNTNEINHLVYLRWHDRSSQEVLDWHRQVQEDVLHVLQTAPDEYFSGKERNEQWPFDLDGHSAYHRLHDIRRVLLDKIKE
jgi:hypothetical protein